MDTIIWGPTKKESSSMKTTRRKFLKASAAASAAGILPTPAGGTPNGDTLDAYQIAQRHLIVRDLPTPDFFEGMLLGNGDVGVCATVRPDALGLHLGKSDSWDIRVSEDHDKYVLTFNYLQKLWERASEEAKRRGGDRRTQLLTSRTSTTS